MLLCLIAAAYTCINEVLYHIYIYFMYKPDGTPVIDSGGRRYIPVEVSHFLEVWVDPAVIQHGEGGL